MYRLASAILILVCLIFCKAQPSSAVDMTNRRFSFNFPALPYYFTDIMGEYRKLEITGQYISKESFEVSVFLKNVNPYWAWPYDCDRQHTVLVDRVGSTSQWQGSGLSFAVASNGDIENFLYVYDEIDSDSKSITKCRLKIDHLTTSIPLPFLNILIKQD